MLVLEASASTWYADANATAGNGSFANPWNLQIALTNTGSILAGDTLYLRGGTYVGGFISTLGTTTNTAVIVRSYPFERAILTDNPHGATLGTTMTSGTSTSITITNSDNWPPGMVVSIESENCQLSSHSGNVWSLNRGWNGTTNAAHSAGVAVTPYQQDIIYHTGTNCWFWDLDVTSQYMTNRIATYAYYPGSAFNLLGLANKVINCRIYNTGHPGIGFWNQGGGGEINGCIIWGVGQYDYTAGFNGDIRGRGIYSQNSAAGLQVIRNCIFFDVLTGGCDFFGETGAVKNCSIDGNIAVGCALEPMAIQSGSSSTSNTYMINNLMTGVPKLSYVSKTNVQEYFTNNVVVNGFFSTADYTNSAYTYNTVFFPSNSGNGQSPVQYANANFDPPLGVTWDNNTYFVPANSSTEQFGYTTKTIHAIAGDGGGILYWTDLTVATNAWTNWTGFDLHTLLQHSWPNNFLTNVVQTMDYDSNLKHVCVISTSGQTNTTLDLSANGFGSGDVFELRDAQNPLSVVTMGIYTSGTINLPLNLTNFASISGSVTNFTPQHYNVGYPGLFNAFILRRYPARARVHN